MSAPNGASSPRPKKPLPPALAANLWNPGQSGNPGGLGGAYAECLRLAREASPRAMERLKELMESDDERVAAVACNAILDRAFGKPKEIPSENGSRPRPDLSPLSDTELAQFRRLTAKLAAATLNGKGDGER